MPEYVWLTEERTFAVLVKEFAYYSLVRYTRAGIEYEVFITNDEYEYREENDVDDTTD